MPLLFLCTSYRRRSCENIWTSAALS